jgi:NitT/TauT family transport system permease protein
MNEVTPSLSAPSVEATFPVARSSGSPRAVSSNGRSARLPIRIAAIAGCIAAWQFASMHQLDIGIVKFANVPAPTLVLEAGWAFLQSPKLLQHVQNSLMRVFVGFAAAAAAGVGLGLLVGRFRVAEDVVMPPLEVLRPIPGVAWIPLAILMFPSSELSMIFITFIGALFPILLNTVHGVENVERRLIDSCQCLGARPRHIFLEVILPGALPNIVTGMSIGMGTSWFCLVTAEMIAGQYGIGYYTWESYNLQRYPEIVVGMLTIGVFGMLSSALVKRVGFALMPWYDGRKAT